MLYFLNPDDLLIPNMMIDTSPWSSCSCQSPWLPCSGHTISSTGPSVSPFRDFFAIIDFPAKRSTFAIACHTYLESYDTQLSFGLSGKHFSASYEASESCWQSGLNYLQHLRPCHMWIIDPENLASDKRLSNNF